MYYVLYQVIQALRIQSLINQSEQMNERSKIFYQINNGKTIKSGSLITWIYTIVASETKKSDFEKVTPGIGQPLALDIVIG